MVKQGISVIRVTVKDELDWSDLLTGSANGTLFHDLRFLRYHPEGRFNFNQLIVKRDAEPIALLPGGLVGPAERPLFCSPLGASIGGFVVSPGFRLEAAVAIVEAVQDYAQRQGWAGIEISLPPSCYSDMGDLIAFALFHRGFQLEHRWLCHVLPLTLDSKDGYAQLFRSRQIAYVRAAQRKGLVGVEMGLEGLSDFFHVFRDTFERHGTTATHSEAEIHDLMARFPDRIRIHLAMLDGIPMAALLVFHLTTRVANTFYICRSSGHENYRADAFIIADVVDRLSAEGFRYLDLGPSTSEKDIKPGVAFFKEGLGSIAQCRDRWRWNVGK